MLSRTVKLFVLPALAISLILALRVSGANPSYPPANAVFTCDHRPLKAGREDVAHFQKILEDHHAIYYCMVHKHKNGKETPLKKGQCPDMVSSTSSEMTSSAEFTLVCAGAHVTQQAGFATTADRDAVAAEFQ